jgi:hypothetical protein
LACCRFRGQEDTIVPREPECGYDKTAVQPRVITAFRPDTDRGVAVPDAPGHAFTAAFMTAGAEDALHIGRHDPPRHGFGNAVQEIALIVPGSMPRPARPDRAWKAPA